MTYLFSFVFSFCFALVAIPFIRRWAIKRNIFDSVDARKLHTGNIPRLGGSGIYFGFLIGFLGAVLFTRILYPSAGIFISFWAIFAAGFGFFLLGLVDDLKRLSAKLKFIVQCALAICVVLAGYRFSVLEIPVSPFRIDLGLWSYPLTVLWIVGIANAVNLLDGMDGLAGGISLIGVAVWAILFFKSGQSLPAQAACAAAGAILGFLFFNFPPASIFMGDSGSLFLGYLLAVLPLLGYSQNQMESGLVPAITVCLIPILDTFAAILRRWRRGVSFLTPDKYHVHHKLLNLGFSTRQILAIIYTLCIVLGACVLAGIYVSPFLSFVLMMAGWAVCGSIFVVLHFLKKNNIRLFE